GTLTISGTGAMTTFTSTTGMPWNSYKSSIKSLVVEQGVTTISQYAFHSCTKLTSVSLPAGLKSAGQKAFYGCTTLQAISLPNSVTSLGSGAFTGCKALSSVQLSEGMTSLASNIFENCTGLTAIALPSGIKTIEASAFTRCSGLVTVALPDALTSIGASAFQSCSSLSGVQIPAGVTRISDKAFSGCSNLATVRLLGDRLTTIGISAFLNCTSLTSLTIPDVVDQLSIMGTAFKGCTGLTEIVFLGDAPSFSATCFTDVTAEARYPGDNATWTLDMLQDYGGSITWAARGDYGLAIDGVAVTGPNAADVLGDGVFAYDAASNTLTVSGSYANTSGQPTIRNSGAAGLTISVPADLTLSGACDLLALDADTTITGEGHLRLQTVDAKAVGVGAGVTLTVDHAAVAALNDGGKADYGFMGAGAGGSRLVIDSSALVIIINDGGKSFSGFDGGITPIDAEILGDNYVSGGEIVGETPTNIWIQPAIYDLKIDGVTVRPSNCADVLGNGVFAYDPDANVLTIHDSYNTTYTATAEILIDNAIPDLTIVAVPDAQGHGPSFLTDNNSTFFRFIYSTADITITGDCEFYLQGISGRSSSGVYLDGTASLTLDGASLSFLGMTYCLRGNGTGALHVIDSSGYLDADVRAISGFGSIDFTGCTVVRPEGYQIVNGSVVEADGSAATFVEIGDFEYDLYVCGQQVFSRNSADILGDGVFSYDADSNTLTIHGSASYAGSSSMIENHIDGLAIAVPNDAALTFTSATYSRVIDSDGI
ncbi:MAG: leucine-rich repeat domain-containing protein, partial [Oscillospiraceae bacterium]|nr:leucine-rich repeat domain-containing protein [Oscillospiraceae bacterium]